MSTSSRSSRSVSGYSTPASRVGKRARTSGVPPAQLHAALSRLGGRLPASMGELKNIDTTIGFPAFGVATGTLTLLNGCAQGTTATTRLGRRITMKSLYVRGFIQMAPTSTGNACFRILIVYDKQANATAPAATDILVADAFANLNNLSNSRRFVTLMDHVTDAISATGEQSVHFELYKKLNKEVEFNAGSAGTVGDIQTGSVYALVYQSGGSITTATATNSIIARIRYSDN